jgi:hypothetical protein
MLNTRRILKDCLDKVQWQSTNRVESSNRYILTYTQFLQMFLQRLIVTAHLPPRPILFLVFDTQMTAILVVYSEIFNYNENK